MTINNEDPVFRLAVDFVNHTSKHLFLTGKAGTGKTTFLKYISQHSHKQVLVTAPTGVAAINAGGVTLHSLFQLPFEPYIPHSRLKDTFKFSKQKRNILRQAELLIIDEVSMLRADMLDAIDATLRFIRRNFKPFGGIQMLYIGDMFQLPPVVKEGEWRLLKEYYKSPFFFHAKALQQAPPLYLELKKVYRQHDQQFVDLLNRVRNNVLTDADSALLNQRYQPNYQPAEDNKQIILCTHNYQADRINTEKLAAIRQPAHTFSGEITGEFPEYSLPTDMHLQLKEGAQIMFIKNDSTDERRYYNGKIAEITEISGDQILVRPENSEEAFPLTPERWKNVRYTLNKEKNEIEEEELGAFKQFPVRLAWAITIHKSQGLTFDRVVIDAGRAFAAGQAYVALSRCTSLEGIILHSPITPECIRTDAHAVAFSRNERPVDVLEKSLVNAKQQFLAERLIQYFDWKPLLNLLDDYRYLTADKISNELQNAHELAGKLYVTALQQEKVAQRFQLQLEQITAVPPDPIHIALLKERCTKAVLYFYQEIRNHILLPLQLHKETFTRIKKAKAYWRKLHELEDDVIYFTNRLALARYNNEPMIAENISLPSLRKEASTKTKKEKKEPKKETQKNQKEKEEPKKETPKTQKEKEEPKKETPKTQKEKKEPKKETPKTQKEKKELKKETPKTQKEKKEPKKETPKNQKEKKEPKKETPKTQKEKKEPKKETPKTKKEKKKKLPKGESQRISLQLFREGKTIPQIAEERNLALSTIEGHIIEFVKTGEILVTDLVPEEKIAVILPLVQSLVNGTTTGLSAIKEQLGDLYSYMEIKAVLNHFIRTIEK